MWGVREAPRPAPLALDAQQERQRREEGVTGGRGLGPSGEVGRGRRAFPQDLLSSTDQCAEVLA